MDIIFAVIGEIVWASWSVDSRLLSFSCTFHFPCSFQLRNSGFLSQLWCERIPVLRGTA